MKVLEYYRLETALYRCAPPVITYTQRGKMKKNRRLWFTGLLMLVILPVYLQFEVAGQVKPEPKDGANLAPADLNRVKPGAEAPDFTLENHDGRTITLSDYRGKKHVVLVFYRGYW